MLGNMRKKKENVREISLDDSLEIREWAKELKCTEPQLRTAVKAVGHSEDAVREYLQSSH